MVKNVYIYQPPTSLKALMFNEKINEMIKFLLKTSTKRENSPTLWLIFKFIITNSKRL